MNVLSALALSKKYTADTADQFGAVKGSPCIFAGSEVDGNVTKVTFQWTNNSGQTKTQVVSFPNGADGNDGTDGVSIVSANIDANSHLILTLSNSTTLDCGSVSTNAALGEDLTATVAIGAVTAGKKYTAGTKLEQVLRDILIKIEAPTVSLVLDPSTTLYDKVSGSIASITLKALTVKKTNAITKVEFYVDNNLVNTVTSGVSSGGLFTYLYSPSVAITSDVTFKAVVTDGTNSTSSTKTVKFVGKTFYGIVDATTGEPTSAEIKALSNTLKDVKGYKWTGITTDYGKVVYAYPTSFGNLTKISDPVNNFNYTDNFAKTSVTIDGIAYNCYTQINPSASDNVTLSFE